MDAARRTQAGTHKLMRDAWSSTVTGDAELKTSAFLKDCTLEQHVLKWVWVVRGR